jgi:hypothetical protein
MFPLLYAFLFSGFYFGLEIAKTALLPCHRWELLSYHKCLILIFSSLDSSKRGRARYQSS